MWNFFLSANDSVKWLSTLAQCTEKLPKQMIDNFTLRNLAKKLMCISPPKICWCLVDKQFLINILEKMKNEIVYTNCKVFQTMFLHSKLIINTSPEGALGQHLLLLFILRPQVFLKWKMKTFFFAYGTHWESLFRNTQLFFIV